MTSKERMALVDLADSNEAGKDLQLAAIRTLGLVFQAEIVAKAIEDAADKIAENFHKIG